jgi:CHAT domain-containing protein
MLRKLPARVRRITVFPDDQLHAFPFAVLPSGETGKRVLDGWAVTIGVRRAQPSVARRRPTRVTIAAANGGTHLQEAPKQVQWLVKWWTERGTVPVALSGDKCDATAFLSALSSSDAVHFSGHGRFDPGDPENTGIVVPGLGNGEEVISLARLAATDCSRLRFATFLSCWSADSFLFPGQWSVSIPSALCRAGAACVIAPLWEIEDSISTQLLLAVYQGLGDRRVRRVDEAVRQAQLDARALPDGRMQSLFFWAGLQVFGDGGPISFSRGIRWRRSTA